MDSENKQNLLETYIASLSDKDREDYKDLIEECRIRDARISADCDNARQSLQTLAGMQIKMLELLKELESASDHLLKANAELYLKLVEKKRMHS